jgi:hypothetical protein
MYVKALTDRIKFNLPLELLKVREKPRKYSWNLNVRDSHEAFGRSTLLNHPTITSYVAQVK